MTTIKTNFSDSNHQHKQLVLNFYHQLVRFNLEALAPLITDNLVYTIYGDGVYRGREGLEKIVKVMSGSGLVELVVENMIVEGELVSSYGSASLEDGSRLEFSEIIAIKTVEGKSQIARIDSYNIML